MNALMLFVGWCLLFLFSWPLALLALVLAPVVWLLSLPFRLLGIAVGAVFALLRAILFLPARLLGAPALSPEPMIRPPYRPTPEANEHLGRWILASIVALVLVAGFFWWRARQAEPPLVEPMEASPFATTEPAIKHPLDAPTEEEPAPAPDVVAPSVADRVAGLVGTERFNALFEQEDLARRLVVTIDNLPRPKVAARLLPAKPVPGTFVAAGEEGARVIGAANFERYDPWVGMIEALGTDQMVALYRRLYPQLQQEYESLGNPGAYFNDRVVEVIDHLLATPEPPATLELSQPNVLYEFADPALESRSAGQKLLLRMGPGNAARVKAKLAEVRKKIATAPR